MPTYARTMTLDAAGSKGSAAATPTIEPGSQEVNITVSIQFEIK